jgi:hypothetical protein
MPIGCSLQPDGPALAQVRSMVDGDWRSSWRPFQHLTVPSASFPREAARRSSPAGTAPTGHSFPPRTTVIGMLTS